jgi:hypothetical protein
MGAAMQPPAKPGRFLIADVARPEIDQAIRDYWQSPAFGTSAGIRALLENTGWKRGWVYKRAAELALTTIKPGSDYRFWSPAEESILEENPGLPIRALVDKLKRAGFARTWGAVAQKRRDMEIGRRREEGALNNNYSTGQLGAALGVSNRQVYQWIRTGLLAAKPLTGSEVGEMVIRGKDVRKFLIEYTAHVKFSRIDRYFLVDILTGECGRKGGME